MFPILSVKIGAIVVGTKGRCISNKLDTCSFNIGIEKGEGNREIGKLKN